LADDADEALGRACAAGGIFYEIVRYATMSLDIVAQMSKN